MEKKKVSIVIPTVGGTERRKIFLDKGLESLFAQTIPFDEILVLDNSQLQNVREGSKYATDKRVHWKLTGVHLVNALDSWNMAVKLARNSYIILLGDDDYAMPYAHEEIQKCLKISNLAYLPVMKVNMNGDIVKRPPQNLESKISSNEFRYNIMIGRFWVSLMGVVFLKKDFIYVSGFQDALIPHYGSADFYLWYRLSTQQSKVACSTQNCFCYLHNAYIFDWVGEISSFKDFSKNIINHANLVEQSLVKLGITKTEIFPGGKNGKQKFIDQMCIAKYIQGLSIGIKKKNIEFFSQTQGLINSPISLKGMLIIPIKLIIAFWYKLTN